MVGASVGFKKADRNATLAEVKGLRVLLKETMGRGDGESVCRQYLLARYYVSLLKLDSAFREGLVVDFGPVNKAILTGLPWPDPSDWTLLY
jgi:hypothetical protein